MPSKLFKKDNDFDKSIETKPVSKVDYHTEGEVQFNAGHYTQAMEYFQAAIAEFPDRENAYLKLSETYMAMDRKKDAIAILYKLLSLQPDNSSAQKMVAQLQNFQPIERPIIHPKKAIQVTGNIGSGNLRFTVNGVSFEMVYVEGGTFTMGATAEQGGDADSDEKPTHRVTLSTYYIGQTEVTQALWKTVMGDNPSYNKGDNLPVDSVNWYDCQEFIRKLNHITGKTFRLPTEAEWEYAARGGSKSRGYKYSGGNVLNIVGWYRHNIGMNGMKIPVIETKSPNELGLYNMSGNVWEWYQDCYGDFIGKAQTNPMGLISDGLLVIRGGSWNCEAKDCRVSTRSCATPNTCISDLGFRFVFIP